MVLAVPNTGDCQYSFIVERLDSIDTLVFRVLHASHAFDVLNRGTACFSLNSRRFDREANFNSLEDESPP